MKRTEDLGPLTPLRISNGALKGTELPSRIKLLDWGRNETTKGPVLLDERTASVFAANQRANGFERVALDYEHNTIEGTTAYKESREPRPVAAYGTPSLIPGDGLYLENLTWTPSGKTDARNYEDLSPAPRLDAEGRVNFLHSVALARNGAVYDLSFFNASTSPTQTSDMTKEEINALLKPISDQLATLSADLATLKAAKPAAPVITLSAGEGKTSTLTLDEAGSKIVKLETELAAMKNGEEKREKDALIARFGAEGKVPLGADGKTLTIEALSALPLDQIKLLHANTPATVPLNARGRKPAGAEGAGEPKGLQRAIAAHLGETRSVSV